MHLSMKFNKMKEYVLLANFILFANIALSLAWSNQSSLLRGSLYDSEFIADYKIVLSLKNPRFRISSPGFPEKNYLPNSHITYEIQINLENEVKQLTTRILSTFEFFSVQESTFCSKDGLEIADLSGQTRVYCGVQVGRTILSEGSKLYIRFFSDTTEESRGYSIILEMYNTECSTHFQNVESGTFSSPNYPGRYYADDICAWKIDVPEGKRILVKFENTFDIRAHEPLCVQDYLSVSVTGDFKTHIKRYCHGKRPVTMYSPGNSMLFLFRTDCCFEGKGFSASFTAVDEDSVTPTPQPDPVPQFCTCGKANTGEIERILGGKTVSPSHRYPWVVALEKKDKNGKDDYFCGGALINRQYVLTAAHCLLNENVTGVKVSVGAYDSATDTSPRVAVSKFIIHQNYDKRVYINDIALLKLDKPVKFNRQVSPICLPTEKDLAPEGSNVIVTGWGLQNFMKPTEADTSLKEVQIPIVSNPTCVAKYGGVVMDTNICAGGEEGKDACGGDSGGPLLAEHKGKWYSVGIVSWGVSCGRAEYPGVYTRVSEYLKWITDNADDAPPCDETVPPPVLPNLENCGLPNEELTERIVGGIEATPFEYPWMALIVYDKTVTGAGALVSPYYVITAASTFDNVMEWYPDLLDVFLGRHSLSKGKDNTSKRYAVKTVYKHPQYGIPSPYNNDLALLRLTVPQAGVSEIFRPICLPRTDAWYPPDLAMTTAGWGSTSNSGVGSSSLRKVDLNMWSDDNCKQRYPGWFTNKMLCAYKQGADTCHGDKGAPLMRLYYGRYYLAGLSSWASKDGCAIRNAPRVFSAAHANLKWISAITGLNVA